MPDRRTAMLATAVLLPAAGCRHAPPADATPQPVDTRAVAAQVRAAEEAFAATMAARDLRAFGSFVGDDAVFINGGQPLRGKAAVLAFWERFFTGPTAPFAWRPEIVEVAAGGTLGYTEGPVLSPAGQPTGRFYTTWQREPQGGWRVAFDNGYALCR